MKAPEDFRGEKVKCSKCGHNFVIVSAQPGRADSGGEAAKAPSIPSREVSVPSSTPAGVRGAPTLLIQRLGCPNCGAAYDPKSRDCRFCGSVLMVTSVAETFARRIDAQQVANALTKWRHRQKEEPDNAEAHFALGLSYLNSHLRDAALVHLRKAALLAPEVADTHYNFAVALFNDGDILFNSPESAEAMKEIDYCTRLAPDFVEAIAFRHFFLAGSCMTSTPCRP